MNRVMIKGSSARIAEYEWDHIGHTGAQTKVLDAV
jgi:hypothetical protein